MPYGELQGEKKTDGGIAWWDITIKNKDSGLSYIVGATEITPIILTSPPSKELNKQTEYLIIQLNNSYLSWAKKYATNNILAIQKAKLIWK